MSTPSVPDVFGRTLRATRTSLLAEVTEEEKAADRERRASRPPREEGDRGGRDDRRGGGGDRDRGRGRR